MKARRIMVLAMAGVGALALWMAATHPGRKSADATPPQATPERDAPERTALHALPLQQQPPGQRTAHYARMVENLESVHRRRVESLEALRARTREASEDEREALLRQVEHAEASVAAMAQQLDDYRQQLATAELELADTAP
ncbi:MAG: hypothetical protein PVI30_12470 [Myxococcales bacterium]|jgi:hypothetical protein